MMNLVYITDNKSIVNNYLKPQLLNSSDLWEIFKLPVLKNSDFGRLFKMNLTNDTYMERYFVTQSHELTSTGRIFNKCIKSHK